MALGEKDSEPPSLQLLQRSSTPVLRPRGRAHDLLRRHIYVVIQRCEAGHTALQLQPDYVPSSVGRSPLGGVESSSIIFSAQEKARQKKGRPTDLGRSMRYGPSYVSK